MQTFSAKPCVLTPPCTRTPMAATLPPPAQTPGLRGNLDEGVGSYESGTYINGFYERRPIQYGETAYGFPTHGQTMLNVTDGKVIGAVGVSGVTGDQDEQCAKAGLGS